MEIEIRDIIYMHAKQSSCFYENMKILHIASDHQCAVVWQQIRKAVKVRLPTDMYCNRQDAERLERKTVHSTSQSLVFCSHASTPVFHWHLQNTVVLAPAVCYKVFHLSSFLLQVTIWYCIHKDHICLMLVSIDMYCMQIVNLYE